MSDKSHSSSEQGTIRDSVGDNSEDLNLREEVKRL